MSILLHGATNSNSSNFGDFIYGNEIYRICKSETAENIFFYEASDYFKKYVVNYSEERTDSDRSNGLVYIPGGYLIENKRVSAKESLLRFLRYFPVGLEHVLKKKPICFIGIGAGPVHSIFVYLPAKILTKKSVYVTTRDEKSSKCLSEITGRIVPNYGDAILAFDLYRQREVTQQILEFRHFSKGRKVIFIHYNHSHKAMVMYAEACSGFAKKHPEYCYLVSSDCIVENENELYEEFANRSALSSNSVFHFKYENPFEMIALLGEVDFVITSKLHVGVVASSFGKSVISTAVNYEKTARYYEQIFQSSRCADLYRTTPDQLVQMMEMFCDKPIDIPQQIIDGAREHIRVLCNFLKKITNEKVQL